jgi:Tfp pilus assembly protein PilV
VNGLGFGATSSRPTVRLRQLGVSLIEALVAMTVVGIGMVSLVGVQASLRANSDVSKQRSEAVRLGQSAIEQWRSFATMAEYQGYDDLTDAAVTMGNGSYTVERSITEGTLPLRGKALSVAVSWTDRTDTAQVVRLSTMVAGISPELGASLALAPTGGATRGPGARNLSIPRRAVDLLDGTSALQPTVGGSTVWRFQNLTGEVQVCTLVDTALPVSTSNLSGCTGRALLYSGYVRYAITSTQPTAADAQAPSGPVDSTVTWSLVSTAATNGNGQCFDEAAADNSRVFYCIVPLITPPGATPTLSWSGRLDFGPAGTISTAGTDTSSTRRKVCRYAQTVYPLTGISQARINQNYLVIPAGNNLSPAFSCPAGTSAHQPAS